MARTRHGVVAVCIAATLLAACGGSKKAASTDATTSGAGASTNSSVDSVETSAASPSSSASSSGGNSSGNAAGLPSNFPTDRIPVPGDVTVTNSSSIDGGDTLTYFVSFTTGKSVGDISDYYAGALKDQRLAQDHRTGHKRSHPLRATQARRTVPATSSTSRRRRKAESSGKTDVGLQSGGHHLPAAFKT